MSVENIFSLSIKQIFLVPLSDIDMYLDFRNI